ncbi:MAG: outer membrane protein assembly factor BamB [Pirellulaceae bacterium]|jgi:outer membrane protein assembly factor BamB
MTFIFVLALVVGGDASEANRWPGFLGAGANELAANSLPLKWSAQSNIGWQADIPGYGQSSPVVWDGKIFVTSLTGNSKEKLLVSCFQLSDGKKLWSQETESTNPEKNSVYISRAAPTPVVDANGVYAYFESGDVVAVSHAGVALWKRSLSDDYAKPSNEFGLSASPVQTRDHVIVLIDDEKSSYLVALDKAQGTATWKTERGNRTSWSSPAIVKIGDSDQVVCSSAGTIDGYSPETGKLLWTFTEVGGNTGTTPLAVDGGFLIAASPGRSGDNTALAKKSNGLMVVKKVDEKWVPAFKWVSSEATPSWASPMSHRGFAYWVNRTGVVFCIDVKTGEQVYAKRIKESAWATPIGVGDYIYIFGKRGITTVIKAGREFEIVAENALWTPAAPPKNNLPQNKETSEERKRAEAMFSHPTLYGIAAVKGKLIMRTGSQLYCIQNVEQN